MTSSFNIQPQRQLRDTFEQPEQRAEIAPPAQPEQVSQQRGGQLLDFTSYQPDLELQDKVNSIANLVETGQGLMRQNVKDQAEKVGFQVDKLFDQISQYQLDTVELGETARQLRKKGRPDLAEQVISTNPWFKFHYYNKKAETAATKSVVNLNDYVTNNMGRLQQIEDPTEVTAELVKQNQNYLKQNYPDIPDRMYSGLVAPALAKAMPLLQQNIAEKRAEYNVTLLNAAANETLDGGVAAWMSGKAPGKLAENLRKAQFEYMATGKTAIEFAENIRTPFLTNLQFDVNKNGVNDFKENPQLNGLLLKELSGFDLGDGQGMLLDYKDSESGKTMRQIIRENRDAIEAQIVNEESIADKRNSLEYNRTRRALQTALSLIAEGDGNGDSFVRGLKLGQVNTVPGVDENGQPTEVELFIPRTFSRQGLQKLYTESLAVPDPMQLANDKAAFTLALGQKDEATQNDILNKYPQGSTAFNSLLGLREKSLVKAAQFETEISNTTNAVVVEALANLNAAKEEALKANAQDEVKRKQVQERYDNVYRDKFKNEAKGRAEAFIEFKMQDATLADLQNKEWWAELEQDLKNDLKQNEQFSTDIFNLEDPNQNTFDNADELAVTTRLADGAGSVKKATIIYTPQEFLVKNRNKDGFKTYYTREPMVSKSTFDEVVGRIQHTNAPELSDKANNELKNAMTIFQQMQPEGTLSQLIQAQSEAPVFNVKLVNDEKFSNAIKALEEPISKLSIPTTQTNSTRAVRTHGHPNYGQRAYGAVDFYLESKDNSGNNDVNFVAPTNVKVVGIHQNYGSTGYGNYIDVEVLTPFGSNLESKHNLNKGDVIRIAHARSGHTDSPWPVQVGDVISAGNPLGRQHTVNSYKTNVDGGTGMHLHVELRRGGSNINQLDMVTIFDTILQTGLAD
jgi:murein DD-endopeptidase MepM/ murein hydrolase activator NlpD